MGNISELTTTFRIANAPVNAFPTVVQALEEALVKAIHNDCVDPVTAYFVEPDVERSIIRVGLRFEGMYERRIEAVATNAVETAIHTLRSDAVQPSIQHHRVSTQLVGV